MQTSGINAVLYWDWDGDRDADRRERDRADRGGNLSFVWISAVLQIREDVTVKARNSYGRTKKYPRRTARVNVFLCSFH